MNREIVQALVERLKSDMPQTALIIAPQIPSTLLEHSKATDSLVLTHVVFESFEESFQGLGRYDFAAVMDTLEGLNRSTAEQLVSRLRDLHSKLLWVAVADGPEGQFSGKDAVAQGMRMVDASKFGSKDTIWYEFSLKFYKPVPQWLNARDWANPDRWDKERW